MKVKGALFDLDGVIIDSEGAYTLFWADIERRYPTGIPDYPAYIKGTALTSILAHYATDDIRADILGRIHAYEATMRFPVFPGALEFLHALRAEGVRIALVTSSDSVKMGHLFAQLPELEPMFDAIVNGSMVTRSKPDPQGYLMAAEALGCDPADCWVFEDSLQGLAAGAAAGATVVGLATTNPREALQGRADLIIDSLDGLTPATLEQQLSKI